MAAHLTRRLRQHGFLTPAGAPTARTALWLPLGGALISSTGVALWLFR